VSQQVDQFWVLQGIRHFITVLTTASQCSLSCSRSIQCISSHTLKIHFNIILPMCLGLLCSSYFIPYFLCNYYLFFACYMLLKGKVTPLQTWTRPWGFRMFRLLECLDIRHMKVVRFSALRTDRFYTPGDILGTHSRWRLSRLHGHSTDRQTDVANSDFPQIRESA
jgi:hypothetical protein